MSEYHVDELEARQSKIALSLAALILFIGTPLVFYFSWDYVFVTGWLYSTLAFMGIFGVPFAVYLGINRGEQNRVNLFNRTKLNVLYIMLSIGLSACQTGELIVAQTPIEYTDIDTTASARIFIAETNEEYMQLGSPIQGLWQISVED